MSFDSFFSALTQQESGGNFGAVNGRTGALGAYQILPSNIRPWSRQYLGYEITPSQFLNNPGLQTKLARAVLSAQFNRYGAAGAASWWYSGSASNQNSTKSSHGEPSVAQYVQQVLSRMTGDYGLVAPPSGTQRFSTLDKRKQSSSLDDLLHDDAAAAGPLGLAGTDRTGGTGLGEVQAGLGLEAPEPGVGITAPDGAAPNPTPVQPEVDLNQMMTDTTGQVGKWLMPVAGGKFSSAYGMRNGKMHTGTDFAVAAGTPLRAMGNGVVVFVGPRGQKGNVVRIRYADGTESLYAHMSTFAAQVGQTVRAGAVVGYSGNTGHSTGPHLHLEIRNARGQLVDPAAWLRQQGL